MSLILNEWVLTNLSNFYTPGSHAFAHWLCYEDPVGTEMCGGMRARGQKPEKENITQ
jgi:hypothetical protein